MTFLAGRGHEEAENEYLRHPQALLRWTIWTYFALL